MAEISKNKPKILIFSLAYAPFIGGAEIAVQKITKRLSDYFEFDVITCNLNGKQKEEEWNEGVKIYRVGNSWIGKQFFHYLSYKKAIELHQENNYLAIWSIMANRAGLAALKFKEKFSEVKYLLTLQEGDPLSHIYWRTWFWWWRYKKIYQQADHIQVLSAWLEKRARKFGYQKEISIVPNGVDINKFKTQNSDVKIMEELDIPKDTKIIFTTSRLVKKNNVMSLIKATKMLLTDYKIPVNLLIAGEGELKKRLKFLTHQLAIKKEVNFLGYIYSEDLPKYYNLADVFVRPSLSEGFGISFVEAMSAGVPVVATPVGGILDFLIDGETGWFCEPKNPESIAEKINYILDKKNQAEVERVVANAKKMVMEKYTWDVVATQMKEVFDNLIKNKYV
ncbi:MAG TPA: glycosyltransferase family 4 protein [bacterium]|nr:glycosyltransferase family 4 protein [bacterium]